MSTFLVVIYLFCYSVVKKRDYTMTNDPNRNDNLNVRVENKSSGSTVFALIILVLVLFGIWYFFGGAISEWFQGMNTPAPQSPAS